MFAHIQKLIDLGHAYVGTDNTVYFSAKSFPTYGAISGNTLEKLKPGHRYDYVDDGAKQFHADWALWKSSPNRNEMVWNSPWGTGFPGWHIECSAMSLKFLEGHVDLHIGGIGEHLLFEGRKMSKSAGNVVLVSHLLDKGLDPLALRFCFLENRYRSQMDLSWESIIAAHQTLAKWRSLAASTQPTTRDSIQAVNQEVREIVNEIVSAFCDDLDTPRAMQILRNAVKSSLADNLKSSLLHAVEPLFGLALTRPIDVKEPSSEILQLLEERRAARAAKDFKLSDALRKRLDELGIAIHDGPEGQRWEWKF
jgi:cysteinyl-tRNA synthetase